MIKSEATSDLVEKENIDLVKGFFDRWQLYKKVMDNNYLHHLET